MTTPTTRTRRSGPMAACGITALGLVAAGCGQLVSELSADQMAGAILISTPAIDVPGTQDVVPAQAAFSLEFASVNDSDVTSGQISQAVSPTDGAVVTLQFTNASGTQEQVSVPGQGNGVYAVTSANSALTYVQGQMYTATISYAGTTYQLQSAAVPAPIGISLSDSSCTMSGTTTQPVLTGCQAGTDVTVGRVPSSDTSTAFYEVSTLGSNNMPTLVTTNAPDTALSFLEFILPGGSAPFQVPTFDVAGSNFKASSVYVVSLTSVNESNTQPTGSSLGSLFAGSTFLAGAAAAGVVQTK